MTPNDHVALALDKEYQRITSQYADRLAELLGPLWPPLPFKVEHFGLLTKYTLGQMPDGRWAMLHRLDGPDQGPPHNHPCRMDSYGIEGGYVELVYKDGRVTQHEWGAGTSHVIDATCVHKLIALPWGASWTLVFTGPVINNWRHFPELEAVG